MTIYFLTGHENLEGKTFLFLFFQCEKSGSKNQSETSERDIGNYILSSQRVIQQLRRPNLTQFCSPTPLEWAIAYVLCITYPLLTWPSLDFILMTTYLPFLVHVVIEWLLNKDCAMFFCLDKENFTPFQRGVTNNLNEKAYLLLSNWIELCLLFTSEVSKEVFKTYFVAKI